MDELAQQVRNSGEKLVQKTWAKKLVQKTRERSSGKNRARLFRQDSGEVVRQEIQARSFGQTR